MKNVLMPLVIVTGCFVAGSAAAHEAHSASGMTWAYDPWCCNGNSVTGDCQAIPSKSVKVVKGGYEVTLSPGDHRLVTKPHHFFVEQAKVKVSQDDDFHACLFPTEDTLRCFYAPPPSF